jgi:hypothetical protein
MSYVLNKLRDPTKVRKIALERLTEPIHLNLASLVVAGLGSYRHKVLFDLVLRPQYAYGVLQAADLAAYWKTPEIACVELGVASGAGLMNMAQLAYRTEQSTGIRIQVHGFDSGVGMPAPKDHRDHPELYGAGDYPMDQAALVRQLPPNAHLHVGQLNETIPAFLQALRCPIGFAALDVDYYSSSKEALTVFDGRPQHYLPQTLLYVDDIEHLSHHPGGGELLAIGEFNTEHLHRKISPYVFLRSERVMKNAAWIDHMFVLQVLDHVARAAAATQRSRQEIMNPYLKVS